MHDGDSVNLTFTMVIGKTNVRQEVCLNMQLYLLLKEFGWTGFHWKTYRLVKRMREWLGIFGYAFKDALLTAAATVASNLNISQQIAGHRSVSHTARYTRLCTVADVLKITSRLVVPGLQSRFGKYDQEQLLTFLNSLTVENVRYSTFRSDWLTILLSRLYTLHYEKQY